MLNDPHVNKFCLIAGAQKLPCRSAQGTQSKLRHMCDTSSPPSSLDRPQGLCSAYTRCSSYAGPCGSLIYLVHATNHVELKAGSDRTCCDSTAVEIAMLRGSNVCLRCPTDIWWLQGFLCSAFWLRQIVQFANRASALQLIERSILLLLVLSTSDLVIVRFGYALDTQSFLGMPRLEGFISRLCLPWSARPRRA